MHLDLIALRPFAIPGRHLAAGEPLVRMSFPDEGAARFVQSVLRWSAFKFVPIEGAKTIDGKPPEAQPLLAESEVITADIFDLLAGADPEELAKLKGIGPKKAAEIIENAQAFVAERDAAKDPQP